MKHLSHVVGATPVALALAFSPTLPASADIIDADWLDHGTFDYEIAHMPDFDQKRTGNNGQGGLPNGGRFYCVPSSIMNLFAYAANHGFPELSPGDEAWYLQGHYVEASDAIRTLGAMMATDPSRGTGYDNAVFGATIWLAGGGGGKFVFEHASRTQTWAPKINSLAERGVQGGIVAFCYGRYDVIDSTEGWALLGNRDGGHCVTLARAIRSGDSMSIESRDPSNNGNTRTQASWKNKSYDTEMIDVIQFGSNFAGQMTSLNFDPGDDTARLIDTMYVLRPKASYSWSSSNRITVNVPAPIDPIFPNFSEVLLNLPGGAQLVDMSEILGTGTAGLIHEGTGPGTLAVASLLDGSLTSIAEVPRGARVVAGRHGPLYVMCGERIECYDPELETPLVASIGLEHFSSDIAYDDTTDTVIAWSSESSALTLASHTFEEVSTHTFTNMPQAPGGHVTVGPSGRIWVTAGPPNTRIYYFDRSTGDLRAISHRDLIGITDFDVDDDGRVFACVGGIVNEFMQDPDTGGWMPATDSPSGLDGTPCDGQIAVIRSRTNFDPETMSGPEHLEIDTDELVDIGLVIADCPGDIDGSQIVDFADLLLVLAEWGPCGAECEADNDENGVVDFQDVLTILANWGPCD